MFFFFQRIVCGLMWLGFRVRGVKGGWGLGCLGLRVFGVECGCGLGYLGEGYDRIQKGRLELGYKECFESCYRFQGVDLVKLDFSRELLKFFYLASNRVKFIF